MFSYIIRCQHSRGELDSTTPFPSGHVSYHRQHCTFLISVTIRSLIFFYLISGIYVVSADAEGEFRKGPFKCRPNCKCKTTTEPTTLGRWCITYWTEKCQSGTTKWYTNHWNGCPIKKPPKGEGSHDLILIYPWSQVGSLLSPSTLVVTELSSPFLSGYYVFLIFLGIKRF